MNGAQIPYALKHSDWLLDDPGNGEFMGIGPKGKAIIHLRTLTTETRTLRAPDHEGDELMLVMAADAGDCVVTVLNSAGSTTDTLTFANVLDIAVLQAVRTGAGNGTLTWVNQAGSGSVSASSATFTTLTVNTTATLASAILQFTGATGTSEIEVATNLADALSLKIAAGADIFTIDTSTAKIRSAFTGGLTVTPTQTIASASGAVYKGVSIPATTATLSGSTNITTATGFNFVELGIPTYTAAMGVVITNAASLYVAGVPAVADMATITNAYAIWVDAGPVRFDGNIDMAATASDIVIKSNTAAALEFSDGTTKILTLDTRNTIKNTAAVAITPSPVTIASEAVAMTSAALQVPARTVTLTGTTTTTSLLGVQAHFGAVTVTDSMACTLTTLSNLHVVANANAGDMLTITNSYMISTSIAGAFLTNAGVWTDMACWEYGKEMVERTGDGILDAIETVLESLVPATWRYRGEFNATDMETGKPLPMRMDDQGIDRVGIIYDDLPNSLRCPGHADAVAPGVLASFSLAACKYLYDRFNEVNARLAALESA